MVTGKGCKAIEEGRAFGVQSLSGTGSIRVGAEFLQKQLGATTVYVSEPTWGNHNLIFKYAGYSQIKKYRYWNAGTKKWMYLVFSDLVSLIYLLGFLRSIFNNIFKTRNHYAVIL